MAAFGKHQEQFRDAALKPFEQLAKQNLAMFQAAAAMFTGQMPGKAGPVAAAPPAGDGAEMAALKAQVAALQARIDGTGKG